MSYNRMVVARWMSGVLFFQDIGLVTFQGEADGPVLELEGEIGPANTSRGNATFIELSNHFY